MNTLIFLTSLATLGAYVCRLDALSWRIHRVGVIAVHWAPSIALAFVLTEAAEGNGRLWHCFLVGMAIGMLIVTFRDWRSGPPGYAISIRARSNFERARNGL